MKGDLKIDWCSYKAAKYAVEHWHYSRCMPVGKLVKVGVWERGLFVGVVLFGRGANRNLFSPYGLGQTEGAELVRVALTKHQTPVSRIIKIAVMFLTKQSKKLRLIVSFADSAKGHHGGIYQAGGWSYLGELKQASTAIHNGVVAHKRTFDCKGIRGYKLLPAEIKHRYLMPLDKEMKAQIEPLSKPYPKRVTKASSSDQLESGGAIPTHTLQSAETYVGH